MRSLNRLLLPLCLASACALLMAQATITTSPQSITAPATVNGGTVTASAVPFTVAQTWNNAGVTFNGMQIVITDTASGASSLPFNVLGGAAGTTSLLSVNKSGAATTASNVISGGSVIANDTSNIRFSSRARFTSSADGIILVENNAGTIGSTLKADALPTIASGFGTSPSIVAGSTPMAGAVNVGTGGVATSGVINFNGTAFAVAPFCVVVDSVTTGGVSHPTTISTTQLTLTATAAWTASEIVYWHCISPRA